MKRKSPPVIGSAVASEGPSPTPLLDAMVHAEPDLVDRIFDYVVQLMPEISTKQDEIKRALRDEFAGERLYVRRKQTSAELASKILAVFNGRNASETARELQIGRATVYRTIKQAGGKR